MRRLVFALLLVACVLAACGGGDDEQSVEDVLDVAFSRSIQSGDLKLNAELDLKGLMSDPIWIEAEGPFRASQGKLPAADIELRVGSDGGGQTITSGVLTTGDRAFLKFQDVYYEQPAEQVRRANRAIRRGSRQGGRPLSELGIDPRSWLAEAEDEGDAEVAGVDTRHLSGTLDVESFLRNLNRFVRKSSAALGEAGDGAAAPRLSRREIGELAEAVKDPTFDVYVGKQDDLIRRVSGRIEFDLPEARGEALGKLKSGSIVFSVELANVNGDQEIEAPRSARPLSDLTDSLGAGALDSLGGEGESEPSTPVAPDNPDPPSSSTGPDSSSPEAEAFRRYSECLDKARPEDTEELQRCADLLQEVP